MQNTCSKHYTTALVMQMLCNIIWLGSATVFCENRQQREELAKAWNLMDPLGKGQLSVNDESLLKLFQILKPKVGILFV